jgi:hypothetical protein
MSNNILSHIEMTDSDFLKIFQLIKNVKFKKCEIKNVSRVTVGKIGFLLNWNFFLGKEVFTFDANLPQEIVYGNKYFRNKWNSSMNVYFSSWTNENIYEYLYKYDFISNESQIFDELFIIENSLEILSDAIHEKIDFENYKNENENVLDKMWDECKEIKTESDNVFQLMKYTEKENEKLNKENAKYMRDNLILKEELRDIIKEYKELDTLYKKKCDEINILETQVKVTNEKYEMQKNELMLILDKNESLLDENDDLYEKLANEKNNCFKFWNF